MFIVTTGDMARNASVNVTGIIQEKKVTNPIANGDINSSIQSIDEKGCANNSMNNKYGDKCKYLKEGI